MALLKFEDIPKTSMGRTFQTPDGERRLLQEARFQEMLAHERKRSERSQRPLLLMLLEAHGTEKSPEGAKELLQVMSALAPKTRDTDGIGWYRENATVGVIFTELGTEDKNVILNTILSKFSAILQGALSVGQLSQIRISFHFFPDDWGENDPAGGSNDPALYPDVLTVLKGRTFALGFKRAMDIALSVIMLLICLPLFLVIAIAIKNSSKGPVFYKQKRVGQYGRHFTFLKFRSMRTNNDSSAHREYVSQLIAGNAKRITTDHDSDGVYKLANDDRVTSVGRFLRRTSLDELPQLINVLLGDMSLVGPRPPIPYELAAYQTWHRRRLLQVKPGITGLWQVNGRNRVGFDDMVRFDLHYARTWSPWLDLKILLRTPAAILKGAY